MSPRRTRHGSNPVNGSLTHVGRRMVRCRVCCPYEKAASGRRTLVPMRHRTNVITRAFPVDEAALGRRTMVIPNLDHRTFREHLGNIQSKNETCFKLLREFSGNIRWTFSGTFRQQFWNLRAGTRSPMRMRKGNELLSGTSIKKM